MGCNDVQQFFFIETTACPHVLQKFYLDFHHLILKIITPQTLFYNLSSVYNVLKYVFLYRVNGLWVYGFIFDGIMMAIKHKDIMKSLCHSFGVLYVDIIIVNNYIITLYNCEYSMAVINACLVK